MPSGTNRTSTPSARETTTPSVAGAIARVQAGASRDDRGAFRDDHVAVREQPLEAEGPFGVRLGTLGLARSLSALGDEPDELRR